MAVVLHVKRAGVARLQAVDIDTDRLPPQLRMLIKHLGFQDAVKLVQALGGTTLYIPKEVQPEHVEHRAYEVLGADGFARLVEHYGSTGMALPKVDSLLKQARHQHVMALLAKRMPIGQIALMTGYCVRSVELIRARHTPAEVQGDLFDGFATEVKD